MTVVHSTPIPRISSVAWNMCLATVYAAARDVVMPRLLIFVIVMKPSN